MNPVLAKEKRRELRIYLQLLQQLVASLDLERQFAFELVPGTFFKVEEPDIGVNQYGRGGNGQQSNIPDP